MMHVCQFDLQSGHYDLHGAMTMVAIMLNCCNISILKLL
jgi:hypothetical protein